MDIGSFEKILRENKIKWDLDRSKPGWQGRYRMNGRQKLAAVARRDGHILVSGRKVSALGEKRWRKVKEAEAAS